jgi:hypothetical protein
LPRDLATVESMGENPEQHVTVLQSRIRERLAELRPVPPGTKEYTKITDDVIRAATELIAYEERLPVLLDQGPRRLSLLIVRWSGVVAGAVGLSLAVAAIAGWLSRWWLLPVVLAFVAAVPLLQIRVPPPCGEHMSLRPGAVLIASGALAIAVCPAARLPVWGLVIGVLAIVAGLWHVRRYSIPRVVR